MYSPEIAQAMTLPKFGEINRDIDLCNNDVSKIIYKEGYNPAYKFDLYCKAFVANTNAISVKTDENQVIDESSWPHCGYGEAVSEICGRLSKTNKFQRVGRLFCVWMLEGY